MSTSFYLYFNIEIEVCRSVRDEERAAEERRKTVVVGDMKPLGDALPQIPSMPE